MRPANRARRGAAILAVVACAALAATACGPVQAGSAAIVGQTRITDEALGVQVAEVTSALGVPGSQAVSAAILNRLITQQLVFELGARNGVTISSDAVNSFLAEQAAAMGGREAFEEALLEKGIPARAIPDAARATLIVAELGGRLAPNQPPEDQEAATVNAATTLSKELDTRVSPRFGTWDAQMLQVGPPPDDLSKPAPRPDVTALGGIPVR